MAVAMIGPKFYAWDRNGKPLAFGKLYTYQARTNTPKVTYQSEDQVVANSNPVILNGEGYADVYLDGSYKMVLKDDKDNEIWSSDPVTAQQAEEWVNCSSATYINPTTVTLIDNQTEHYDEGRRVRVDNDTGTYSYSQVVSSSYGGGVTTIILLDSVVTVNVVEICASIIGINSIEDLDYRDQNDLTKDYFFNTKNDLEANGITFPVNKILKTKGLDSVGDGRGKSFFVSNSQVVSDDILMSSGQYASLKELISTDVISQKININTGSINVGLLKNQAGATQDRHVMFFGDSHGWGQGAPQYDGLSGVGNISVHSAPVENQGFMSRCVGFLNEKLNTSINHYGGGTNQVLSDMTYVHCSDVDVGDPETGWPIIPVGGNASATYEVIGDASETNDRWMAPDTRVGAGDDYSYSEYREKLQGGLFTRGVTKLEQATANNFTSTGRDRYWELKVDSSYVPPVSNSVPILFDNQSGGGSAAVALGYRSTTTQRVYLKGSEKIPEWMINATVFIPGWGYARTDAISGDGTIQIRDIDASALGSDFSRIVAAGMKIYPEVMARGLLMIEMRKPARAMYLHVIEEDGGGNMRIGFVNNINNGYKGYPGIDEDTKYRNGANPWSQLLSAGTMGIFKVEPDSNLTANPPNTVRDAFGVKVDTNNGGAAKEVVYRLDLGSQMQGRIFISFDAYSNPLGTETFKTRGVVFDNNKFQNYSMGGHTVGAWLGEEDSFSNETRDHVTDILNYTPVQPSHVITQIPFVNEYLKQTPIATFKTRLQSFVSRFENHLSSTNNYNSVGVDFMFFTSLRNMEIAFEGGSENAVTYDMYVQAAKEFCEDNNHAFVDCEQRLFDLVDNDRINYPRLYNNSNHPSDYANEMIFEVLKHEYLYAMVG